MPEYTVAQILAAFRAENPDAAHIDDKDLFKAIAMEDPELVKGAVGYKAEPVAPQAGPIERFATSAVNTVKGTASSLYHAATDPMTEQEKTSGFSLLPGLTTAKRVLIDPQIDQAKKALESYRSGRTSEAVGHGVAAALPVFGPAAAQVGEQAGTGDFAGAAGTATAMYGMGKAAEGVGKAVGASPEALQDLATRARMVRDAHPSVTTPLANVSIFRPLSVVRYGPEAAMGIAGKVAGAAAPVLDAAAKAKIAMGATPRGATYAPPNPVDRIAELPPENSIETPLLRNGSPGIPELNPEPPQPAMDPNMQVGDSIIGPNGQPQVAQIYGEGPKPEPYVRGSVTREPVTELPGPNGEPQFPQIVGGEQPPIAEAPPVETPVAEVPPVERAVPPNVQNLAHALIRRGRGAVAADRALTNAKYLLDMMPELEGLSDVPDSTGIAPLDRAITEKLDTVGHKIDAALQAGAEKQVSTVDAKARLGELIDEARNANQTTAALKIAKLIKILGDEGTASGALITSLRQGMKESGLKLTTRLGSDVYDVFRGLTKSMDPELPALNQQYYTAKTAAELAEIRTGGPSEASQIGMGTRPKADFREAEQAKKDAAKAETKSKADAAKAARDKQKAEAAKKAEELKRKEGLSDAGRASRDKGFRGGPL